MLGGLRNHNGNYSIRLSRKRQGELLAKMSVLFTGRGSMCCEHMRAVKQKQRSLQEVKSLQPCFNRLSLLLHFSGMRSRFSFFKKKFWREDFIMFLLFATVICLPLAMIPAVLGGNVLVFPHEGSHWVNMRVLIEELHSRGHNVTVVRAADSWYISQTSPHYKSITLDVAVGANDTFFHRFVTEVVKLKRHQGRVWSRFGLDIELKNNFNELRSKICEAIVHMFENEDLMQSFQDSKVDIVLTDPAN